MFNQAIEFGKKWLHVILILIIVFLVYLLLTKNNKITVLPMGPKDKPVGSFVGDENMVVQDKILEDGTHIFFTENGVFATTNMIPPELQGRFMLIGQGNNHFPQGFAIKPAKSKE